MTTRLRDRIKRLEANKPLMPTRIRQRFVYANGSMEGDLPPDPPDAMTVELLIIDSIDGRPSPQSVRRFGKEILNG